MDPTFIVAALALAGSGIAGFFALRGQRVQAKVSDDANLRDDQREFIAELRSEKAVERDHREKLELEVERLRLEIVRLRLELERTRAELEQERQARRAGDAGLQAEHQSRTAGSTEIHARQAGDQARQDIHDETEPKPHGPELTK